MPTSPGVYTVVASFAGSADYSPKSVAVSFVIARLDILGGAR